MERKTYASGDIPRLARRNSRISDAELCNWWTRVTSFLHLHPPSLKDYDEMPSYCRERHVHRAYRPNPNTVRYCIKSALHPTNETLNFWTHFLPMVFLMARHFYFFHEIEAKGAATNELMYPFWTYSAGCMILLGCSSFAHLFNCISPRMRHLCFCSDYGAISVYSVAGTIAYFYFVSPPHCHGFNAGHTELYIPVATTMAIASHIACCHTRFPHVRARYVLRTMAYVMPFLIISTPALLRLNDSIESTDVFKFLTAEPHLSIVPAAAAEPLNVPETQISCNEKTFLTERSCNHVVDAIENEISNHPQKPAHTVNGTEGLHGVHSCQLGEGSFLLYYSLHLFFFVVAAFFNVSRFPECKFPGRFDVVGGSHQLFHIAIALGVINQSVVIEEAIRDALQRAGDSGASHSLIESTALSTLGLLFSVSVVLFLIVLLYGRTLTSKVKPQ